MRKPKPFDQGFEQGLSAGTDVGQEEFAKLVREVYGLEESYPDSFVQMGFGVYYQPVAPRMMFDLQAIIDQRKAKEAHEAEAKLVVGTDARTKQALENLGLEKR